jgi:hypothetical protein
MLARGTWRLILPPLVLFQASSILLCFTPKAGTIERHGWPVGTRARRGASAAFMSTSVVRSVGCAVRVLIHFAPCGVSVDL